MLTYTKRKSYKRDFSSNDSPLFEYKEKASEIKFADSHTDASYYQPTSSQIETFMQAGKTVADNRRAVYDFNDGKDDGSPVPPDRVYTELADVSQAVNDEHKRLKKTASQKKEAEQHAKEHSELIEAVQSATSATILPDSDENSK